MTALDALKAALSVAEAPNSETAALLSASDRAQAGIARRLEALRMEGESYATDSLACQEEILGRPDGCEPIDGD